MVLLSTFAFLSTRHLKEQPTGVQNVAEMLVQGLVFALLVLMYFVLAIESHDETHEEGSHTDTDRVANEEQRPEPIAA
ncbi:MAG TPA: hypothetical protein VIN70_06890, partial [Candidatus Limnocylindria bacterium]